MPGSGREDEGAATPMLPTATVAEHASKRATSAGGTVQNGSMSGSGGPHDLDQQRTVVDEVAARTLTPRQRGGVHKTPTGANHQQLFERSASRWWNPQFSSALLESQYWRCSFPQLRDRFRSGLIYIIITCMAWFCFHAIYSEWADSYPYQMTFAGIIVVTFTILGFTFSRRYYQRFYLPTSFLLTFLIFVVTLLVFGNQHDRRALIGPMGTFAISVEFVLVLYTVIPLPLYLCVLIGVAYSAVFELLGAHTGIHEHHGVKLVLHVCIQVLGVHIFILSQVRHRKTFLKVGQSLLARKDLEVEKQFKDHMIQSVMPSKIADELLTSELRRPSTVPDAVHRTSGSSGSKPAAATGPPGAPSGGGPVFRPFTMNMMTNVSILFADIAGFTKMSSNKSADELVTLLNDLFGRFDNLCMRLGCEKISTLGDCYYCVSGCPESRVDHAKCCVEMGLAMIVAIRQFDDDRGQEVNMRVGIHTGKVMCGLVGTKRFKFDVFSNDVTLANTMESTGLAGEVHISDVTANFLGDDYLLREGEVVEGLKTYFINGRKSDLRCSVNPSGEFKFADSSSMDIPDATTAAVHRNQTSFRKKIAGKLKTLQTSSLPASSVGKTSGGSLRMKLIANRPDAPPKKPSSSQDVLRGVTLEDEDDATRKSTSLQMLTSSQSATAAVSTTVVASSPPDTSKSSPPRHSTSVGTTQSPNVLAQLQHERLGGKPSKELANGGSSGGTSTGKGSKSSGLQNPDEFGSMAALESMAQHHAAGTSLTRFDTDRDFDRRLADVISGSDLGRGRGYWIHRDSLNPWTLQFKNNLIEAEYRRHFSHAFRKRLADDSDGVAGTGGSRTGGAIHFRYSAVLIDVIVAAIFYLIIAAVAFCFMGVITNPVWLVYFVFGSLIIAVPVGLALLTVIYKRDLLPPINLWVPRHILGLLMIGLPSGAAICNLLWVSSPPGADFEKWRTRVVADQLLCGYILLTVIFGHCSFSQLSCWPKTLLASLFGILLIVITQVCVAPSVVCNARPSPASNTSAILKTTTALTTNVSFNRGFLFAASADYRWEMIIDVLLALLLIAFLNYQFEASFRMSFYGDLQARRDTEMMQSMRDQADWLLSNIIPHFVVEDLKSNTKYSENHEMAAVVFASIINWNDMYEENFEGGREFLRVLNEMVGDFDELLDRQEFCQVEKIKTIGPCYMAASGLNPERRRLSVHPYEHLYQLMEFTLAVQEALDNFNQDLLNFDFVMKVGFNVGPVTAGVIGTTKLYYDIWGDTVNIASRMYSTGVKGRIQVPEHVKNQLCDRYDFEYRGHVDVKGIDGGMNVYLLVGRKATAAVL